MNKIFLPVFGLDEETRQTLRLHLASRAALDEAEKRAEYGTPQIADRSVWGAVNWHLGVLWQDRPVFLLLGVAANLYLIVHGVYALAGWVTGLF